VVLLVIAAFPLVSLYVFPELLENIIRDLSAREIFLVSLVCFLTAASAVAVMGLTLLYGDQRLGANHGLRTLYEKRYHVWFGLAAGASIPGFATFSRADQAVESVLVGLGAGVAGLIVAVFLLFLAWISPLTLDEPSAGPSEEPLTHPHKRGWIEMLEHGAFYFLPREGYRVPKKTGWGRVYNGHWYAIALMLVSGVVYGVIARSKFRGIGEPSGIPTLAFIVLFLLVVCWLLSALTFLLDRYRIPVTSLICLWVFAATFFFKLDHVFPVEQRPASMSAPLMNPGQALALRKQERAIVISAAGGGIQAAAWTARVLGGLQQELGDKFSQSIGLLSGVSGGSVGIMYFASTFQDGVPDKAKLPESWQAARTSSLDDIAWGLVVPDFLATLFPFRCFRDIDRGWAMERAFEKHGNLDGTRLSDWIAKTQAGRLPPILFNSTIEETGRLMVFSTTRYPSTPRQDGEPGTTNFWDLDPDWDIDVVTAARLSATFPYVTPVSRPAGDAASVFSHHLADGGYYDNIGTASLVGWLDEALSAMSSEAVLQKVLILRIISFPPDDEKAMKDKGWPHQLLAPLLTVVHVTKSGQQSHSATQIDLLKRVWNNRHPRDDESLPAYLIDSADIQFEPPKGECEDDEPPLSWRLREDQKECIDKAWDFQRKDLLEKVNAFLTE
jgi:hypothetical protein